MKTNLYVYFTFEILKKKILINKNSIIKFLLYDTINLETSVEFINKKKKNVVHNSNKTATR